MVCEKMGSSGRSVCLHFYSSPDSSFDLAGLFLFCKSCNSCSSNYSPSTIAMGRKQRGGGCNTGVPPQVQVSSPPVPQALPPANLTPLPIGIGNDNFDFDADSPPQRLLCL